MRLCSADVVAICAIPTFSGRHERIGISCGDHYVALPLFGADLICVHTEGMKGVWNIVTHCTFVNVFIFYKDIEPKGLLEIRLCNYGE